MHGQPAGSIVMTTSFSVPKKRLPKVLEALGVDPRALSRG